MQSEHPTNTWRLGVVSYLNARPLTAGLEADPDLELMFDVPARSALRLEAGQARVDVRPENAAIVGFPSLEGQIGVVNRQNGPRAWLRTRQNAEIEETEFVFMGRSSFRHGESGKCRFMRPVTPAMFDGLSGL